MSRSLSVIVAALALPLWATSARADCGLPDIPEPFANGPFVTDLPPPQQRPFGNDDILLDHSVLVTPPGGVWVLDSEDAETSSPSDPQFCAGGGGLEYVVDDPKFLAVRAPADAIPGAQLSVCESRAGEWRWSQPGCSCVAIVVGAARTSSAGGIGFSLAEAAPLALKSSGCTNLTCSLPVVRVTLADDVDPTNVLVQVFINGASSPAIASLAPTSNTSDVLVETNRTTVVGVRVLRLSDGAISDLQSLTVSGSFSEGSSSLFSCASQSTSGALFSAIAAVALAGLSIMRRRRQSQP
ncbi:MAG TPA: hypothetical protein VGO62_18940 [Myxococcota bacterium]|jgi:hypothetical protein